EVDQAEEVHLQQPDLLQHAGVVLRYIAAIVGTLERRVFDQRIVRDDDARGVHGGVPGKAFQPHGGIDEVLHFRLTHIDLLELRIRIERLFDRDVQRHGRNHAYDAVDLWNRHGKGTARVFDGGACGHRAEGYDLCNVVASVLVRDILDDLAAPCVLEVHVN